VDQRIAGIVAEIEPFVFDSAEIREADIDLLGKVTKAPAVGVAKLPNPFPEPHFV